VLEQAPTFRPFGREFITFFEVTGGTCENKVRCVVRAATRQGNDVLKVILCQFLAAVVAFLILLPGIQILDFLGGEGSAYGKLTGASLMLLNSMAMLYAFNINALPSRNLPHMHDFPCMLCSLNWAAARFATRRKATTAACIRGEVLKSGRENLFAYGAAFICFLRDMLRLSANIVALLAMEKQMAFLTIVRIEKLKSFWKFFEALVTASLGYTGHDKGHSLSGLWVLPTPQGHLHVYPNSIPQIRLES